MPSIKKYLKDKKTNREYVDIRTMYDEKYFNLFLNSRENVGMTREEFEYTLRKFWAVGKIAAFKFGGSDAIAFAQFSPQDYNMYNFPIHVNLVNEKAVSGLPNTAQLVGKDVVLGWALHTREPIYKIVSNYLDRIADVEMAIRMNVKAHKIPLAINVSEENESTAQELNALLESDEYKFFIKSGGVDMLQAVSSGAPFILDKLHAYKVSLENELLTFLGIDNIAMEKKERLITDEANGNNELIANYAQIIDDCLDGFSKEIKKVFGVDKAWPRKQQPIQMEDEEHEDDEE